MKPKDTTVLELLITLFLCLLWTVVSVGFTTGIVLSVYHFFTQLTK